MYNKTHINHILTWNYFEYYIFDLYSNNLDKNKFPVNGMCRYIFFKNCDHSLKFHTQFLTQVNYIQFLFLIIWFNSKICYKMLLQIVGWIQLSDLFEKNFSQKQEQDNQHRKRFQFLSNSFIHDWCNMNQLLIVLWRFLNHNTKTK